MSQIKSDDGMATVICPNRGRENDVTASGSHECMYCGTKLPLEPNPANSPVENTKGPGVKVLESSLTESIAISRVREKILSDKRISGCVEHALSGKCSGELLESIKSKLSDEVSAEISDNLKCKVRKSYLPVYIYSGKFQIVYNQGKKGYGDYIFTAVALQNAPKLLGHVFSQHAFRIMSPNEYQMLRQTKGAYADTPKPDISAEEVWKSGADARHAFLCDAAIKSDAIKSDEQSVDPGEVSGKFTNSETLSAYEEFTFVEISMGDRIASVAFDSSGNLVSSDEGLFKDYVASMVENRFAEVLPEAQLEEAKTKKHIKSASRRLMLCLLCGVTAIILFKSGFTTLAVVVLVAWVLAFSWLLIDYRKLS